jgi:2-iminobutanoate/2-iminopropanoate deaminase
MLTLSLSLPPSCRTLRASLPSFPSLRSQTPITNPPSPKSQAISIPASTPLIYVSGQIPSTAAGELVTGTIGERTAACIANIRAVLAAAGSDLEHVVKVNVFLTDMKNFKEMNEEYAKHFTGKPARSTVAVHQLPMGVEVEIECIAMGR